MSFGGILLMKLCLVLKKRDLQLSIFENPMNAIAFKECSRYDVRVLIGKPARSCKDFINQCNGYNLNTKFSI
jgi:hypothetical protein